MNPLRILFYWTVTLLLLVVASMILAAMGAVRIILWAVEKP